MMTANEYRAKAVEALRRGDEATIPAEKAAYAQHARDWTAMAITADAQSKLEFALLGRNQASDDDALRVAQTDSDQPA